MPPVLDMLVPRLRDPLLKSLRQTRRPGEEPGEERLTLSGWSWEGYEALDDVLGEDRSSPRLYFLDGTVEIMSISPKHEELKKWIADLMAQFFIAKGIRAYPRGQATIKRLKDAGAEPDESWTFGERKEVPDLVLEIALTSGGVPKLELYQRLEVPEVWFWRKGQLEVWTLAGSTYTGPHQKSSLLPEMPLAELQAHAQMEDWMQAVQSFRHVVEGA